MSKPSTDTATERAVQTWRQERELPARLTLRFLALLRPGELESLERRYSVALRTRLLPGTNKEAMRRLQRARLARVRSELAQRPGHQAKAKAKRRRRATKR